MQKVPNILILVSTKLYLLLLEPTVNELLSQYRKLLLPDVIVDEWTDEKYRQWR